MFTSREDVLHLNGKWYAVVAVIVTASAVAASLALVAFRSRFHLISLATPTERQIGTGIWVAAVAVLLALSVAIANRISVVWPYFVVGGTLLVFVWGDIATESLIPSLAAVTFMVGSAAVVRRGIVAGRSVLLVVALDGAIIAIATGVVYRPDLFYGPVALASAMVLTAGAVAAFRRAMLDRVLVQLVWSFVACCCAVVWLLVAIWAHLFFE